MPLTLNQLKKELKSFFQGHAQINSTLYESDFDFNAERNLTYPLANIEYIESSIANRLTNHVYKITIADLVNANIEDHADEVVSDSMQVAEDLFTWLQNHADFAFNKSTSIQNFVDDTSDITAGITFRIVLSVTRLQNECSQPTS